MDTNWGDRLARAAEAYAREAFDVRLELEPLPEGKLPHFLLDRYRFWRGEIFGRPCVFMAVRPPEEGGMADIDRHRDLLRRLAVVDVVVLLLQGLNAKERKRLIERRVAFMAPGTQLYVPEMLLDQREHFRPAPAPAHERFSPTAQVVAIAALLGREIDGENATALARRFGVAPMSMGRALDELEAAGVVDAHRVGRQRQVRMKVTGGELWRAVENRLHSPVRKVRGVVMPYPQEVRALLAGESALARYTALASPRTQRLAIAAADWNRASREWGLQPAERFDPRRDEIETWSYDPACLTRDNVVDPLSLYLSVRDSRDERVAQAADQLLETMPW